MSHTKSYPGGSPRLASHGPGEPRQSAAREEPTGKSLTDGERSSTFKDFKQTEPNNHVTHRTRREEAPAVIPIKDASRVYVLRTSTAGWVLLRVRHRADGPCRTAVQSRPRVVNATLYMQRRRSIGRRGADLSRGPARFDASAARTARRRSGRR